MTKTRTRGQRKRAPAKSIESVETFGVLPLPGEVLTRTAAVEWLRDWATCWARVLETGLNFKDEGMRRAYGALAFDFASVLEAAVEAATTGARQRFGFLWPADWRASATRDLALILASNLVEGYPHAPGGKGYAALAQRLVDLLAEQEAKPEAA